MKSKSLLFFLICLLLVSAYISTVGIISMNRQAIIDQINQFMQTALFPAGIDMMLAFRKMFMTLLLAGAALLLIGLTGLLISIKDGLS